MQHHRLSTIVGAIAFAIVALSCQSNPEPSSKDTPGKPGGDGRRELLVQGVQGPLDSAIEDTCRHIVTLYNIKTDSGAINDTTRRRSVTVLIRCPPVVKG